MRHIYLWKVLWNVGFPLLVSDFHSAEGGGQGRRGGARPQAECVLRRPGTLRLNSLPSSASRQGGPLYFFLHHSGTGGQESESQGLSTSEIKRTSQGRTHTGLGQDWGGGPLSSQWALPLSSLPPGHLVCRTLALTLGSVAVFFPKGNLDAVGQTDMFQATGEYRVMVHRQGSILSLHLTSWLSKDTGVGAVLISLRGQDIQNLVLTIPQLIFQKDPELCGSIAVCLLAHAPGSD